MESIPTDKESNDSPPPRSYWFFTTRDPQYNLREVIDSKAEGDEDEWPVCRFTE